MFRSRSISRLNLRRFASTFYAAVPPPPPSILNRIRTVVVSSVVVVSIGGFIVYAQDSNAGVHRWVALPIIAAYTRNDPEKAHEMAVALLASGIAPKERGTDDERLSINLWGRHYSNPLGMAAGFDKHGEAIDGLFDLGFGYVEIGSITPEAQPGNPKPRVFRIPESDALINRYGFNSQGHLSAIGRLRSRIQHFISSNALLLPSSIFPPPPETALPDHDVVAQLLASPDGREASVVDRLSMPRSLREGRVLAINLGKNKTSPADSIDDFVKGVEAFGPYADVLVVNVSSPNTPGLRDLQRKGVLEELLAGVVAARNALTSSTFKPPVLVKVAPDLDAAQLDDIAHAVLSTGIDGIIISNTTISRPSSAGTSSSLLEAGGLSGPPVKPLALAALSALYAATEGKIPLIGCGGIATGADAIEFAKAGASLVQLYTGFIYGGIGLPVKLKTEITEILKAEGKTWSEIIGTSARKKKIVVREEEKIEPVNVVEVVQVGDGVKERIELSDDQLLASMEDLIGSPRSTSETDLTSFSPEIEHELATLIAELSSASKSTAPPTPELVAAPAPVAESFVTPTPLATPIAASPSGPVPVIETIEEPVKGEGKRWV